MRKPIYENKLRREPRDNKAGLAVSCRRCGNRTEFDLGSRGKGKARPVARRKVPRDRGQ